MYKDKPKQEERQEKTRELEKRLVTGLWPLLVGVKQKVDRRLVHTFLGLVMAILLHRHRNPGLWLVNSEAICWNRGNVRRGRSGSAIYCIARNGKPG